MKFIALLFLFLILVPRPSKGADNPNPFPDLPPTGPADAIATFDLNRDFQIELVAAEPLIADPVAMSFDENGALYVVEMRDYSERREEKLGRVKRLEDRDHDGRMDHATVFTEGLPWPTGVMCYDGGVFVIAAPDLWYFKDTNGDGQADEKRIVLTGFAEMASRLNVQQLPNNIRWGMDQQIHVAEGGNGSRIRRPDDSSSTEALELRGRDLVFNPKTMVFRAENGGGQFGMTFDDAGRKFVSSNSEHLQAVLYERIAAAPDWGGALRTVSDGTELAPPTARINIAADGGAAPVFRLSPDEAWRVVRTRWRVAGQVSGPVEGGGRASGYFTGATGIQIYRGDLFAEEFQGNAFIADVGSNLIHRKMLRRTGPTFVGERAPGELNREFLASTDNWFRPVQLDNGPDGALYVLDFYRELIEHPWSLPPGIKEHLDLNRGNDRGRIWRVVPKHSQPRREVALGSSSTAGLVRLLEHPNGWHRDTASRLLLERSDSALVLVGLLRKQLAESTSPVARIHSLALLKELGGLENINLREALSDENADVREHAVRVAGGWLPREEMMGSNWLDPWVKLAADPSPAVRSQVAITLAGHPSPRLFEALLRHSDEVPTYYAFGLMADFHPEQFTEELYQKQPVFMGSMVRKSAALATGARLADWVSERNIPIHPDSDHLNYRLLAIVAGLAPSGRISTDWSLPASIRREAVRQASMALTQADTKQLGFAVLNSFQTTGTDQLLVNLLPASDDLELQSQIVGQVTRRASESMFKQMLDLLPGLSPVNQNRLLHLATGSDAPRAWLFERIEKDPDFRAQLGIVFQNFLRNHQDKGIQQWAVQTFGPASPDVSIQGMLARYQPALQIAGNPRNGLAIFQQRCATCHRAGDQGPDVGPNLVTVSRAGRPTLLNHILDPSREINSAYETWQITLKDGTDLLGRPVGQGDNSITLALADGSTTTVARSSTASMRPSGRSLMPDGLAEGLTPETMADLLRFIEELTNPQISPPAE